MANGGKNGKSDRKGQRNGTKNLKPPWKPGQSGNPKGGARGLRISDILKAMLDEPYAKTKKTVGQRLGEVIVQRALAGDYRLIAEVLNRTEGKVAEHMVLHEPEPLVREIAVDLDRMNAVGVGK